MSGPPKKPTALKILAGNPGRRPLPENEPIPPDGDVVMPAYLTGRAVECWDEYEPILTAMQVLTIADVPMLAMLCAIKAEFWIATADVEARGIEIERVRYTKTDQPFYLTEDNPSVRIASDASKRAARLEMEFGLSPASRTRVKAIPKQPEKSALEKLRERRPS